MCKINEKDFEAFCENVDTFRLIDYVKETPEFWAEFKYKKFLFQCLDEAYYEDVKEWLEKEQVYRTEVLR